MDMGKTVKNKQNEEKIQKALFEILKKQLENSLADQYLIDKEVPIPYKHIYLPPQSPKKTTKLELWCFSGDIVIYKILFDESIKRGDSKIMNTDGTKIDIILEKGNGGNSSHVGLPFVILELKYGQPTTDVVLAYSKKAEMIKTIFPYCQYLFLIYGKIDPRTYRLGVNFDEIISLNDINDDAEIRKLKKTIKEHFKIAKENEILLEKSANSR
jgi:hypothetical protein